jgi:FdhE protein
VSVKTTSLGDLPRESISTPVPIVLPDPAALFTRRSDRLRVLAVAHPMADWLRFLAAVAEAQARACRQPAPAFDIADRPGPALDHALAAIKGIGADPSVPDAARAVLTRLSAHDPHGLAEAWLTGSVPADRAGEAVFIAAALQVCFTRQAATLDVDSLQLRPQRGLCPVCASPPVAGMVTGAGNVPGVRYLHCGLCATAWNHVRVCCVGCGESKGLALHEVEGGNGAVKAETCDTCQGYAKMFYQAKDMKIEPLADDLGSLGLDLMVSEAGWSRLAPNPLVMG